MSLAWKKHRMRCVNPTCPKRTWVLADHRIAAKNCLLTTRAAKWATVQVGGGRTVSEVAAELACDWHTVNDAVITYGEALLDADRKRLNQTTAIGLDETSFVKLSHAGTTPTTPPRWPTWRTTRSSTSSPPANTSTWRAGSTNSPRPGRSASASGPSTCRPPMRRSTRSCCPRRTRWSTPSTSSRLANRCLDAVRRRVQTEQTGHRGRRDDPLYRARRVLLSGEETARRRGHRAPVVTARARAIPNAEVAIAYRVKERLRDFYRTQRPDEAKADARELQAHCLEAAMPPEIQRLGRTIRAGSTRSATTTWPGCPTVPPSRSTT